MSIADLNGVKLEEYNEKILLKILNVGRSITLDASEEAAMASPTSIAEFMEILSAYSHLIFDNLQGIIGI